MTLAELREVLTDINYKGWKFHLGEDRGVTWLQVRFVAPDSETGQSTTQHGRKWLLGDKMTKSEVVLTAFKAVMTAEEHEIREQFKYCGRAVLNPHIDVDALLNVAIRSMPEFQGEHLSDDLSLRLPRRRSRPGRNLHDRHQHAEVSVHPVSASL